MELVPVTASDPTAIAAVIIAIGLLSCWTIIAWGLRQAHEGSTYYQNDSIVPDLEPVRTGRRGQ